MGYACVYSIDSTGFTAGLIEVEVQLSQGLPSFQIVGLPDKAVRESRDRVQAAVINSRYTFPRQKVVVGLAPAERPKEGSYLDLPIALALLIASGQVVARHAYQDWVWAGELSLAGSIRPPSDAMGLILGAQSLKRSLVLSEEVCVPHILANQTQVQGAASLLEVVSVLEGKQEQFRELKEVVGTPCVSKGVLLEGVEGREMEKVAVVLAVAGNHSLILEGAPGVGKTLLASTVSGLMPDLTEREMITVAKIYSMVGTQRISKRPPVRSPHHQISAAGLIGGGQVCQPGEVSLAQHGVLFLDELTEYKRALLDLLREPLQSKVVHIARAGYRIELPADCLLMGAMNPCPCGYYGVRDSCFCGVMEVKKYRACLSGPLLDRIEIHRKIAGQEESSWGKYWDEGWQAIIGTTKSARAIVQAVRERGRNRRCRQIEGEGAAVEHDIVQAWLEAEARKSLWSRRGMHSIVRVARTIADCEDSRLISKRHLAMAKGLRGQISPISF